MNLHFCYPHSHRLRQLDGKALGRLGLERLRLATFSRGRTRFLGILPVDLLPLQMRGAGLFGDHDRRVSVLGSAMLVEEQTYRDNRQCEHTEHRERRAGQIRALRVSSSIALGIRGHSIVGENTDRQISAKVLARLVLRDDLRALCVCINKTTSVLDISPHVFHYNDPTG